MFVWGLDVCRSDDFIGYSNGVVRSNYQINDVRVMELQLFSQTPDTKHPQPKHNGVLRITVRFVLVTANILHSFFWLDLMFHSVVMNVCVCVV